MRVVIQRVSHASVSIENKIRSKIQKGILILVGIGESDNMEDIEWLSKKIFQLRIFDDENGVMNKNIKDVDGEILAVSQFTLMASTKKGNRPSYIRAARPDIARQIYDNFCGLLDELNGKKIATGIFGANMAISLTNDGPVTIIIDSKNKE